MHYNALTSIKHQLLMNSQCNSSDTLGWSSQTVAEATPRPGVSPTFSDTDPIIRSWNYRYIKIIVYIYTYTSYMLCSHWKCVLKWCKMGMFCSDGWYGVLEWSCCRVHRSPNGWRGQVSQVPFRLGRPSTRRGRKRRRETIQNGSVNEQIS